MNWLARLKKGSLREFATATPATPATHWQESGGTVASVATAKKPAANDLATEPPTDPNAWRELAAAYHAHHFKCSTCIAAGRGAGYGLRCGVGAALWTSYQNT